MQFAEAKVCFYMCSKCEKPYFGGLIDCEQELAREDTTRREDLMCRPCLIKEMSVGSNICRNGHGADFMDWKCMYCCSVALFNCGGTRWFCDRCHNEGGRTLRDCKGTNCPLKIHHPPAGNDFKKSAFALGCSICRSEHLKQFDEAQAAIAGMLEEEKLDYLHMDRSLHKTAKPLVGGKGKKKGKMPPIVKKKVVKAKRNMQTQFRAQVRAAHAKK